MLLTKPMMKLCISLLTASLILFHLAGQSALAFSSSVTVTLTPNGPVNRLLLGNNTQWTDNGDGLVANNGASNIAALPSLPPAGTTVLRYPGGSLTDSYHWEDGIGPIDSRVPGRDLSNTMKPIIFGTDEFLSLAKNVGAIPLISVNTASGTADEAASWVQYTNIIKNDPPVPLWEIGNEPYLIENNRPDLAETPSVFVDRFNHFAAAMRAVDPSIKIGLPLRTDQLNGLPVTAYAKYAETVLSGLTAPIDFVALHYYLPFTIDAVYTDTDMYWASMAAPDLMQQDMALTRDQVQQYLGESVPLAITEFNSFFTFGRSSDDKINTLTSALLVGDMLRVFAEARDVLFANFWSLVGNWYFGVIDSTYKPRPAYYLMQMYSKLLQGTYLPVAVSAPTFSSKSAGLVPASSALPLVTSLATNDAGMTRLMVINKSLNDTATVTAKLVTAANTAARASRVTATVLTGSSAWSGAAGQTAVTQTMTQPSIKNGSFRFNIPAHSIALFEMR